MGRHESSGRSGPAADEAAAERLAADEAASAGEGKEGPALTVMGFTRRYAAISWLLVAAWACFIFFMSSNTGDELNEGLGFFSAVYTQLKALSAQLFGADVDLASPIGHFLEYTVFGVLLTNALRCHMPLSRAAALAVACGSLYGVTDEFHQLFVADRMCDPLDWLVDTAGSLVGALAARAVLKRRRRQAQ